MEENNGNKPMAPNAVASLVLGIVAICTSCYVAGLIVGIVGLSKAKKGYEAFNQAPEMYNGQGMLRTGRILSIISVVVGALSIIFWILYIAGIAAAIDASY